MGRRPASHGGQKTPSRPEKRGAGAVGPAAILFPSKQGRVLRQTSRTRLDLNPSVRNVGKQAEKLVGGGTNVPCFKRRPMPAPHFYRPPTAGGNGSIDSPVRFLFTSTMPTIERIGRLRGPLTVSCRTCGHGVVWAVAEAVRRLGGECMTTDARRRLRCSACGERRTYCISFSS